MESSVEDRHLENSRQNMFHGPDAVKARRIVQRSQFGQIINRLLNFWRDSNRSAVTLTTVDDTMTDGVQVGDFLQRSRLTSLQVGQNSGQSFLVFLQGQLFSNLGLSVASQNQPRGHGRPINATLGQQHFTFCFKQTEFEAAGPGVANENLHVSKATSALSSCRPYSHQELSGVSSRASASLCGGCRPLVGRARHRHAGHQRPHSTLSLRGTFAFSESTMIALREKNRNDFAGLEFEFTSSQPG